MTKELTAKLDKLKNNLRQLGSVAIAFSAGVDSTFLLKNAKEVQGDNVLAVTVVTDSFPTIEENEAKKFLEINNIQSAIITLDQLSIPGFKENPKERCYICKKAIFSAIKEEAKKHGIRYVLDGTNVDDEGDYRPGLKALKELGIISPLKDAGFTKEDIREASRELGLSTWNKPAYACLATRIKTGESITKEKLKKIELAEQFIMERGFAQVRVRLVGDTTSIEVDRNKVEDLEAISDKVKAYLESVGLTNISINQEGYKMGNMNGNNTNLEERMADTEEYIMDVADEAAASTDVRLTHEDVFKSIRGGFYEDDIS